MVLPFFLLFLLSKDCRCCFTLVTITIDMRYSNIEECCNSSRPKTPCFHISSLASVPVTALLRLNCSLSRDCSCGLSEVSRLRTPSSLCATNSLFLHNRAQGMQTVNFSPQTHLLVKSYRGILKI